jgi:hypothetical protein
MRDHTDVCVARPAKKNPDLEIYQVGNDSTPLRRLTGYYYTYRSRQGLVKVNFAPCVSSTRNGLHVAQNRLLRNP